MANITADQIIAILQTGTYPYPLTQFFKFKQKFPWFPSVEILRIQPDSYTQDVVKTERNFAFIIRVFVKYNRLPNQEVDDQATIEDEISSLLLAQDFQGKGKIFLDTFGWSREDYNERGIYGSISSIRLGIKDVTSTDGQGYVGAYDILELFSNTSPVQIQILSSSFRDGIQLVAHSDDSGFLSRDPAQFNPGDYTITYENTATLDALIKSTAQAWNTVQGRLIKGSTIYKLFFLIGDTTKDGSYSEIERATTRVTVEGSWT